MYRDVACIRDREYVGCRRRRCNCRCVAHSSTLRGDRNASWRDECRSIQIRRSQRYLSTRYDVYVDVAIRRKATYCWVGDGIDFHLTCNRDTIGIRDCESVRRAIGDCNINRSSRRGDFIWARRDNCSSTRKLRRQRYNAVRCYRGWTCRKTCDCGRRCRCIDYHRT